MGRGDLAPTGFIEMSFMVDEGNMIKDIPVWYVRLGNRIYQPGISLI